MIFLGNRLDKCIFFKPITESDIIRITKNLSSSKACGHDGFNSYVLKKVIYYIALPLTHIFNMSLTTGQYPDSFKLSKVVPIYKKDDPSLCSNYRPISILPCISKILEKIIYEQLYEFLEQNSLLCANQYGFRKHHSTDLAVLEVYDKISSSLTNHNHVIGIFCDLSKAFDTLDHNILLYKLNHIGIRGVPLLWFKNYLSQRKQFVEYESFHSNISPVNHGVPQGSILGPLLFLIYVNDVINISDSLSFTLFADDITILYPHSKLDDSTLFLNSELLKLCRWFNCNKLFFNHSKTNYIVFKNPRRNMDYQNCNLVINNTQIERKSTVKFLGVTLEENLNWDAHFKSLTNNVSKLVGLLCRLRDVLPNSSLTLLYKSLIQSKLFYCNVAWGRSTQKNLNSILILQKKAVRVCTGSMFLSHSNPLFSKLNVLKVQDITFLQTALLMYKFNIDLLPPYFRILFQFNNEFHSYNTRSSQNLHLTTPQNIIVQRSIRHAGPEIWNSIAVNIKQSVSPKSFKLKLKKYLLESYVDE